MKIIGKVEKIFIKQRPGQPMITPKTNCLTLQTGLGIVGDINANPLSPRQVLLVAQETLDSFGLNPGDLRENIVISGFDINSLPSGSVIQIGAATLIRLTFQCEVCGYISSLPISNPRSLEGKRGMLGTVLLGGTVGPNDTISLLSKRYPEIPHKLYQRFLWILNKIPKGKVVTYEQLIAAFGVSSAYFRVIPSFIKRTSKTHYPLHRILDSRGCLISYVDNQQSLLENEGVIIENSKVDIARYCWKLENLYSSEV